jgi:hypothetical protein
MSCTFIYYIFTVPYCLLTAAICCGADTGKVWQAVPLWPYNWMRNILLETRRETRSICLTRRYSKHAENYSLGIFRFIVYLQIKCYCRSGCPFDNQFSKNYVKGIYLDTLFEVVVSYMKVITICHPKVTPFIYYQIIKNFELNFPFSFIAPHFYPTG